MRIELHPEAESELYDAAVWYDDERPGLGDEFLEEMTRWVDVIVEAPYTWPRWPNAPSLDPPIRRILTDRFPFAIAYQASPDHVRILAFAHASRRPFYWANRTKPSEIRG